MKTIKDFTPEIKAKIPIYLEKYTRGIYDGTRYDNFKLEDAEKIVNWNYAFAGYKLPTVLSAENLKEMQIMFNIIKIDMELQAMVFMCFCLKNNTKIPEFSDAKLKSDFGIVKDKNENCNLVLSVWEKVKNQLGKDEDTSSYKELEQSLHTKLVADVKARLNVKDTKDSFWKKEKENLSKMNNYGLFSCDIYSNVYTAWFKFIKDEFQVETALGDKLDQWDDLYRKSNVYSGIFAEMICIVCKYPKAIHVDAEKRMHSVNGKAVIWSCSSDNTAFNNYYIHGVSIEEPIYNKLLSKEFTFADWTKEKNEENKSAYLSFMEEKWGSEYLFRFISDNLKQIDSYTDKKPDIYMEGTTRGMDLGVYTLFSGNVNNIKMAFVRCFCPSTDRMFFLSVNPDNTNAKDAIASLYRIPKKLKEDIKHINRQGERFSTVLTDSGKKKTEAMSKEDFSDLVSISGDKYFSLMKYEY